jgi:hypothetical protein
MSSFLGGTRSGKAARSKSIRNRRRRRKQKKRKERKKEELRSSGAYKKIKKRLDIFIFQDRENELTKNKIKKEGCARG